MNADKEFSTVERFLLGQLNLMSFEEAVKETNNALSDFIESTPLYLDMLVEKRRVEVNTFTKFNEYDISRSRDLQEMGWYTGVPVTNGVWNGLVGRMEAKGIHHG